MSHRCFWAALFTLGCLCSGAGAAPLVTFKASGIITAIDAPNGRPTPWNGVQVNDPWAVTYTVDLGIPDPLISTSTGEYQKSIVSSTFTAGPATLGPTHFTDIWIENDRPGGDLYEINLQTAPALVYLGLRDAAAAGLSSDANPTSLHLPDFEWHLLEVSNLDVSVPAWKLTGSIDQFTVVPEPTTLVALAPLLFLHGRRRPPARRSA